MKAGFFIQLISALGFGLVAGLPQFAKNSLEPRAYVTITKVVTTTVPAVIVHIHRTRTWTKTEYPPIQVSETSYQPNSIAISEPPSAPSSTAPSIQSSWSSEPTVVPQPATSTPGESNDRATAMEGTPMQASVPASSTDQFVVSQPITSLPGEVLTNVPPPAPMSSTTLVTLSSRAFSEASGPEATSLPDGLHGNGYGISYNPYNSDSSCKDSDAISRDIHSFNNYGAIRLYGTDCGQLDTIMPVIKNYPGMKLILGIWDPSSPTNALTEANTIANAVNKHFGGDWSSIHSVAVGNEIVHRGGSVNNLLAALHSVKYLLAPYRVPVVTVETPDVFEGIGMPLCQASDFIAINAHPFFDKSGNWSNPSRAGGFAKLMEDIVSGCRNDRTVIMESGWPHGSDLPASFFTNNGYPVPSPENHRLAIKSLMEAYAGHPENLVVFSAFDDYWKHDSAGTMGVEHYWGILD